MNKDEKQLFKDFIVGLLLVVIGIALIATCVRLMPRKEEPEAAEETSEATAELSDWQMLQMAIAKTESEFKADAVGSSNDRGIFQITPIYVKEANRLQHDITYTHDDAFDIAKSIEMFGIVQGHHNPGRSLERAVAKHNPGGDSIGYSRRVRENYEFVRAYEAVRKELIKN